MNYVIQGIQHVGIAVSEMDRVLSSTENYLA